MAEISKIVVKAAQYGLKDEVARDKRAVNYSFGVNTKPDLNTLITPGFYAAAGNNNATNKPSGVDAFGLTVTHDATGAYYTQVLNSANTNPGKCYRRVCTNGTWGNWKEINKDTVDKATKATTADTATKATTADTATKATTADTATKATTADKVGTETVGSATKPVYINAGTPTACTYTIAKSVPSDAKFTDTVVTVDSAISSTSTNPVQNKVIKAELDKKMPKGVADYIATGNLTSLPITEGVINLNGHTLNMSDINNKTRELTIINGTINFTKGVTINLLTLKLNDIYITATAEDTIVNFNTTYFICDNVKDNNGFLQILSSILNYVELYNSNITSNIFVGRSAVIFNTCCYLTSSTDIALTACNSTIFDEGFGIANGSNWVNSNVGLYNILNGHIENDKVICDMDYDDSLTKDYYSNNAPTTKAVCDALQLKADKTQLSSYVTTTTANSTYLTKTDASSTYAKKSDISTVYKFKGTKDTYSALPTSGNVIGDVWNITKADSDNGIKAGDNVVWTGSTWDNLSGTVDLSDYATTSAMDAALANKVNKDGNKVLSTNDFTNTLKTKLDGIATDATKDTTMTGASTSADGKGGLVPTPAKGDQSSFLRGDGTWVVPTDTKYNAATQSAAGLMSSSDKKKLDGIASGANAYSLPEASSDQKGGVIIGSNITVDTDGKISLTKENIVNALEYTPATYATATSNRNGLMSYTDKDAFDKINNGKLPAFYDGKGGSRLPNHEKLGMNVFASYMSNDKVGNDSTYKNWYYSDPYTTPQDAGGATAIGVSRTNGKVFVRWSTADRTAWTGSSELVTTSSVATTSANGLMSSSDKTKLNGIAANANNYSLPDATTSTKGGVIVGDNLTVSSGKISVPVVTTTTAGVMSAADKKTLDTLDSLRKTANQVAVLTSAEYSAATKGNNMLYFII